MTRVLISVATYQRPELLAQLLESLRLADLPANVRLCIIDNDPLGSAAAVADSSPVATTYAVEPRPGIAAARNRGLREVQKDDDFIVFVDDDERVRVGWLNELLTAQAEYGADVVQGPVVSVFPSATPRWIVRGGFIQRPRFKTGATALSPATNNTLVRVDLLRSLGMPQFDESFSMTGGSDTAFFRRLRDMGATMVWCDQAVVDEDVPISRATFAWIWRRGVREGNVSGRLHLAAKSRGRLAVDGLTRVIYGAIRQLGSLLVGRGLQARDIAYVTRGCGWIGASLNRLVVEYARPRREPS